MPAVQRACGVILIEEKLSLQKKSERTMLKRGVRGEISRSSSFTVFKSGALFGRSSSSAKVDIVKLAYYDREEDARRAVEAITKGSFLRAAQCGCCPGFRNFSRRSERRTGFNAEIPS